MRIAWIAAGAGSMWCGACIRDLTLVRALVARGHQVEVTPLYLPLRTDGPDPSAGRPVLAGGIGVWLREYCPGWALLPRWADRPLAVRPLLALAGRGTAATRPDRLGRLTVSMLAGEDGRQRAAVDELVQHLHSAAPDAVHLTNSLLLGYAPALAQALGRPLHVSLQGEETFVAGLGHPWSEQAQALMRRHASAVQRFWSPHPRHAAAMAAWLAIDPARIAVVPPAVGPVAPRPAAPAQPRLGFLGLLAERKGADLLLEAMRRLPDPPPLRLAGQTGDRRYARALQRRCQGLPASLVGELPSAAKTGFLAGCTAVVVASRIPEERAMVALEALALGVPVVAPDAGIIPDLVASGAVAAFRPGDADDLARALAQVLDDPGWAGRGRAAADWIAGHHGPAAAADAALAALGGA